MIKSLEVIIAITILFAFLFLIFQTIPERSVPNIVNERIFDVLKIKAEDPGFRTIINDGNAQATSDSIYNNIDVPYGVSLCSGATNDCNTYNQDTNYRITTTIDYYFFDSNKTIIIKTWVE